MDKPSVKLATGKTIAIPNPNIKSRIYIKHGICDNATAKIKHGWVAQSWTTQPPRKCPGHYLYISQSTLNGVTDTHRSWRRLKFLQYPFLLASSYSTWLWVSPLILQLKKRLMDLSRLLEKCSVMHVWRAGPLKMTTSYLVWKSSWYFFTSYLVWKSF